MSIIEKIRAEVLRLIRESDGPGSPYGIGKMSACNRILNFLDTLKEQPVCEDVEEAAKAYADDINSNECLYTYTDFTDAFKAGAKWQKEQMLKEAVEGTIFPTIRTKEIDATKITEKFNGGGHKRAAGCTIKEKINIAMEMLLEQAKTLL